MSSTLNFRVLLKIAVATFALNILCQAYHVFVEPYQLYVAYSPNPFFIIIFLFTQVIFHVRWLTDLWYHEPAEKLIERRTSLRPRSALRPALGRLHSYDYEATRSMAERQALEVDWKNKLQSVHMEYLPIYILGNLGLGELLLQVLIARLKLHPRGLVRRMVQRSIRHLPSIVHSHHPCAILLLVLHIPCPQKSRLSSTRLSYKGYHKTTCSRGSFANV
jgi:hypothetical protein